MKKIIGMVLCILSFFHGNLSKAQELKEYTVKKTDTPVVIDGVLDEAQWKSAALTSPFVQQENGDSVPNCTQAKMLWDEHFLYVGFICNDPDVWSTYTERDAHMWDEENVEIFADPDGDGKNYFEMEVNPLGAIFDELVDHSWLEGNNNENVDWNLEGLKVAVSVRGTLNDVSDTDTAWYCEVAIPFDSLDASIKPLPGPPADGDVWRLQLGHYNRPRDQEGNTTGDPETSVWNMTGTPWFHVPEKFGRIIFSEELVTSIRDLYPNKQDAEEKINWNVYPNPVRSFAIVKFYVKEKVPVHLEIMNSLGEVVSKVDPCCFPEGEHRIEWDPGNLFPGIYFFKIQEGPRTAIKKILLIE